MTTRQIVIGDCDMSVSLNADDSVYITATCGTDELETHAWRDDECAGVSWWLTKRLTPPEFAPETIAYIEPGGRQCEPASLADCVIAVAQHMAEQQDAPDRVTTPGYASVRDELEALPDTMELPA